MKSQEPIPSSRPSTNLWGGGVDPYVHFGYGPLKICLHTLEQVSGSMNNDPINLIHTSQQSTKQVLIKELEEDFISIK